MGIHTCSGATLKCTFGMAPGTLMVLPLNRVMTESKPAVNIMDNNKPMVNIMPSLVPKLQLGDAYRNTNNKTESLKKETRRKNGNK